MEHYLIRAAIIPSIIEKIMYLFDLDYLTALDRFYTSYTGAALADDETGLYGQSALHILGLYLDEKDCLSYIDKLKQTNSK